MWRDAWIEGDCIVVKCAIDELSRYHLRDLKEDVAKANVSLNQAIYNYNQRLRIEAQRKEAERIERDQ